MNKTLTFSVVSLLLAGQVAAGTVASGSDGSDGILELTTPGVIDFDPTTFDPPLDADGDGIYHFQRITIGEGVTVKFRSPPLPVRPIFWLSQGDVVIDGTLDLNGENGHDRYEALTNVNQFRPAIPGAGGYNGGVGGATGAAPMAGSGPGGGGIDHYAKGAGASFVSDGYAQGGKRYGNAYLVPLIGGSGGGGGGDGDGNPSGGGGGAGGGAILIVSNSSIAINGAIQAKGGYGFAPHARSGSWSYNYTGGGGSGGSIRLVAPIVDGSGTLSTYRGELIAGDGGTNSYNYYGSHGRIRVEAFDHQFKTKGAISGADYRYTTPGDLSLPTNAPEFYPTLKVTSVAGVPVPDEPQALFDPADLQINDSGEVVFQVEASYIPLGTAVTLSLYNETEGAKSFQSDPLAGSPDNSTATARTTIPYGFSSFYIQASWTEE